MDARSLFMLDVVEASNRLDHVQSIIGFYELRHKVFVDELGWKLPLANNGYEMDEFDTNDTVYVIARDGGEKVVGGTRLLPTDKPHLMTKLFSDLCEGQLPCGPKVLEISRTCTDIELRKTRAAQSLHAMLLLGVTGYCLDKGIEGVTLVVDVDLANKYGAILDLKPLGSPQLRDGKPIVAIYAPINQSAESALRLATNVPIRAAAA